MSTSSSETLAEKKAVRTSEHREGRRGQSGGGLDSIEEEDERLIQLGIRRELRKEFTNFSTISFALGILGYVHPAFIPSNASLTSN